MVSQDTKRLNWVQVETETFEWLRHKANADGSSIGNYAGALLDSLAQESEETEGHEGSSNFWNWRFFEQKRRKRDRVYQAASIYIQDETEEGRDRLAQMCEGVGMDLSEVLQRVGSDPFAAILAKTNDGTKFSRCLHWLPSYIQGRGGTVDVSSLREAASREGFAPSMLDRVKQAIKVDPEIPEIVSEKPGKSWVWLIKEEQQQP